MKHLGKYRQYLFLCAIHDPAETPSWMVDGINRKQYFEAFERAMKGLPSNPQTAAGWLGQRHGFKKRKLIDLVTGEVDNEFTVRHGVRK